MRSVYCSHTLCPHAFDTVWLLHIHPAVVVRPRNPVRSDVNVRVGVQDASHGFSAKVADFGLSREMNCKSRVETRTYGTITHMPPELLSSDVVSKVRLAAASHRGSTRGMPSGRVRFAGIWQCEALRRCHNTKLVT